MLETIWSNVLWKGYHWLLFSPKVMTEEYPWPSITNTRNHCKKYGKTRVSENPCYHIFNPINSTY